MKKILLSSIILVVFFYVIFFFGAVFKQFGMLEDAGEISGMMLPNQVVVDKEKRIENIKQILAVESEKQILFGDLHVHTTFSTDAFMWSLPFFNGPGASPVSDACDFARFCSALDFWSINDHAEASTPRKWLETKESIRQCNNLSTNNDLVSFLGWEWTQVDPNPSNHYGHKNVIFLDTEDNTVPPRAIGAGGVAPQVMRLGLPWTLSALPATLDLENRQRYYAFDKFFEEIKETPICDKEINTRDLPIDCYEEAEDPNILFAKLREYESEFMVIPHGTTWGFYTPATSDWRRQLEGYDDEDAQFLIELYSGHGNAEEYRSWNDVLADDQGVLYCPETSDDFLPTCQQAGNIMAERCSNAGFDKNYCDDLVEKTKMYSANMGAGSFAAVNETDEDEFLDAGQCRDCFQPAFNYRPLGSAQYILAMTDFTNPEYPKRFKFGFIGSSDNHAARPGTGFKEVKRNPNTEARGIVSSFTESLMDLRRPKGKLEPTLVDINSDTRITSIVDLNLITDAERQSAFFLTGGLVAVHADSRSRESIWESLERKETYTTSGPRILLWFDAINGNIEHHMGSEIDATVSPNFIVKVAGSLKQKPGCPDYASQALSNDELEKICNSECYNPTDERRIIQRVEVIKITPQSYEGESIGELISDTWKIFECGSTICSFEFIDEEFTTAQRDSIYYVRAIEEPIETIASDPLGCEYDENGKCIKTKICRLGHKKHNECLAPSEHRAWSSPIFVNYRS